MGCFFRLEDKRILLFCDKKRSVWHDITDQYNLCLIIFKDDSRMKHFTAALKEKKLLYNFFKRFFLWKKIQYDDKILFQKQVHSEYCTCKDWSRMRLDGTRRNLSTYLFVAGLIQIFLLLRLKIQENQILLRNGRLCIKKVFLLFLILGPTKIFF